MKIKFLGANKSVTGSCHCLECNGKTILIDYGMQQGKDEKVRNNQLDVDVNKIDLVIITHAHIDHTGRLPLLVKNGYKGPIIANSKTVELMDIMLRDSAHIQEMEAEWKSRKNLRAGLQKVDPLYDTKDVEDTIKLFKSIDYRNRITLFEGIDVFLKDSGHLLGSSTIKFFIKEGDIEKTIVFSGDIGNYNIPLIRDPEYFEEADYVVMETTYGGKLHDKNEDYVQKLSGIFSTTFKKGGNVVIPSFSVGRTQEILYYIREIKEKKLVSDFLDFPVYVDSPLSKKATSIYDSADTTFFDEETNNLIRRGISPIKFNNLILTNTTDESIAINNDTTPKVIISSSGMCDAGRIRHHLKHNLWRKDSSVIFVGYQAEGTLGRQIIDGKREVKLFGEKININADIYNLKGLSGHADQNGLLDFVTHFKNKPQKIFLVHGEIDNMNIFADLLNIKGYDYIIPEYNSEYDLDLDEYKYTEKSENIGIKEDDIFDIYQRLGVYIKNNQNNKDKIDKIKNLIRNIGI